MSPGRHRPELILRLFFLSPCYARRKRKKLGTQKQLQEGKRCCKVTNIYDCGAHKRNLSLWTENVGESMFASLRMLSHVSSPYLCLMKDDTFSQIKPYILTIENYQVK